MSVEEIAALGDEEIQALALQRPGHPGQYGFMLNPGDFRSMEHYMATMVALINRLRKVTSKSVPTEE
jgi:hypothetical protein